MNEVELTISAGGRSQEPSSLRLVATLTVAGMISGLALAGVYQLTAPIIAENDAKALRAAVYKVVPGSTQMQRLTLRDGALMVVGEEEEVETPVVYGAYDESGRFVGYAIEGAGPGFQDTIKLLYGYDPATKQVIGMEVLESRETPGLGDKIFKDAAFRANFTALAADPAIVVVKDGKDRANEVDAITGATISSKAVVKIINAGNEAWLETLPEPGDEPGLEEKAEERETAGGAPGIPGIPLKEGDR